MWVIKLFGLDGVSIEGRIDGVFRYLWYCIGVRDVSGCIECVGVKMI